MTHLLQSYAVSLIRLPISWLSKYVDQDENSFCFLLIHTPAFNLAVLKKYNKLACCLHGKIFLRCILVTGLFLHSSYSGPQAKKKDIEAPIPAVNPSPPPIREAWWLIREAWWLNGTVVR
jgi:hypothetical protein